VFEWLSNLPWGNIIEKALPSVVTTIGGVLGGSDDKGGLSFEEQMQMQAANNAAALERAKLGLGGGGGGGGGAAIQVAKITDARERQRIKIEAEQAMLSGRLRALELMKPEVLAGILNNRAEVAQQGGASTANNFNNVAQNIGGGYVRAQQNTIGRG